MFKLWSKDNNDSSDPVDLLISRYNLYPNIILRGVQLSSKPHIRSRVSMSDLLESETMKEYESRYDTDELEYINVRYT